MLAQRPRAQSWAGADRRLFGHVRAGRRRGSRRRPAGAVGALEAVRRPGRPRGRVRDGPAPEVHTP
ncbi:hypothetical protein [Streptomyces sp. DSM 110735]|uniref:hypothetical protein n=1 Tax=Streptomyces sp. DSM 110735 TaxID=2775031 RepID=UPI0018F54ED0|nr:hypothetical protein [Streptomyces sp. DSM 110735]MBJ7904178.1 hypothetical protein [Streptomyces sp. DSM 110735]